MINQLNEYTTNMIRWISLQNQLIAENVEVLKGYVNSYNSGIAMMAEYYSNMIKARDSSGSKSQ
ncbi:MAG TPA: hypothetical protein VFJ51_04895 [Nitrososphaeraceae archaeon]|nr:hypothetical protein [Nitrososphaeraceae archaeon]